MADKKCVICGSVIRHDPGLNDTCVTCDRGIACFKRDPNILQKAIFYVCPEKRMT